MTRLGCDPRKPTIERRKAAEIEVALRRHVRVRIEREIRDARPFADKIIVVAEMPLHEREGLVSLFHPLIDVVGLEVAPAPDQRKPEARGRKRRLMAVLLEKHPAQHFRAQKRVGRQIVGAFRKKDQNGVRLAESPPVFEFQKRHMPIRVLCEKSGRPCLAFKNIDLDLAIDDTEACKKKPYLVGIALKLHRIEIEHGRPPLRD